MRGLYAIVDVGTLRARGVDVLAFAAAVLDAHPTALQLRAKNLEARESLAILRSLGPMCRHAHVPLIANDRVDVAVLAGCDMVHLGQGDAPIEAVRSIAPTLKVGLSTHDVGQLGRALAQRPAYVAYGPVYATGSKANAEPVVGLSGLREAHAMARAAGIPLVAIGGITAERARDVSLSAEAGAVIAALLPPEGTVEMRQVTARASRLQGLLAAGTPFAAAAP